MEIIKKGKRPLQRVWYGTCRICGTEAKAEEYEMTNIQGSTVYLQKSIEKCPLCKNNMVFCPVTNDGD
jgi:rubrerythrin